MPAYIVNGTIAAGSTAQNAIAEGHNYISIVIQAIAADLRVMVGADASATIGETVFADTSSTFTALSGQRVSVWSTTNGMAFSIRLAQ